jgi:uncharacterized protein (DUF2252 family)
MEIPQLHQANGQITRQRQTEGAGSDEAAQARKDTFSRSLKPEPPLIPSPLKTSAAESLSATDKASSALLADPGEAAAWLHGFNENLGLTSDLLKEKYALMKGDSLSFLRAAPALFIRDMKGAYSEPAHLLPRKAPEMTIDGDLHIGNLGTYKNREGKTVWGLNDQDQAGPGSPEWDLIRLSTSLVLLGRENGLSKDEQSKLIKTLAKDYCSTIDDIAGGDAAPSASLSHSESHGPVRKLINRSSECTQKEMLKKYAVSDDSGAWNFKDTDELKAVSQKDRDKVCRALGDYEKTIGCSSDGVVHPLEIIDVHEKLGSGGSSYGLKRYWALVRGEGDRPAILELKQLLAPAVIDTTGDLTKADGKAMVNSQKKLGGYENPLTGNTEMDGFAYLVREREPSKGTLPLEELTDIDDMISVTSQASIATARAHGHTQSQAKALSKWIGDNAGLLRENLISIATRYADQTEADYKAFKSSR